LYAMKTLAPIVERCMKQNHTIDVYEKYFENDVFDDYSEPPSAKGLAVIRDPSKVKRSASSINWHPEINTSKIAVSYSIMNFQDERLDSPDLSMSVSLNMCVIRYGENQKKLFLTCFAIFIVLYLGH